MAYPLPIHIHPFAQVSHAVCLCLASVFLCTGVVAGRPFPSFPGQKLPRFFPETLKLCPHAPAELGRGWGWALIPLQVQFSFGQGRTFPAPSLQKFVSSTGIPERQPSKH